MAELVRIPITLSVTDNCFTLRLSVGGGRVPIDVMLDTGSSMTVVNIDVYDPTDDPSHTSTSLLQTGSFAGAGRFMAAVVRTPVGLMAGGAAAAVTVPKSYLGIIYNIQPGLFGKADGILGLGYTALNSVIQMPADTLDARYGPAQLGLGKSAGTLPPYFDQLVTAGQVGSKFAFSVQRSISSKVDAAVNDGIFVVGGGEQCTDLYSGDFTSVAVAHEGYYGTNLIAVQVGDRTVQVPPMPAGSGAASNSFIDSGNSGLMLSAELHPQVVGLFNAINPAFGVSLQAPGMDQGQLDLAAWPPLRFVLQGAGGARVTLTVEPKDYWQFDSYGAGRATTGLSGGGGPGAGQSILGLPLLSGHYVVFDRTGGPGNSVVKFAAQARPAPLVA